MKNKIIIANWKMNKNLNQAEKFVKNLAKEISKSEYKIVICPDFTSMYSLNKYSSEYNFEVGSQNCFWEEKGAFTGEVSALMLKNAGVKYVILGHSERRKYFSESNEIINKKIKICLENDLIPIVCVGEDINLRQLNQELLFVNRQILECLEGISNENIKKIIVAYEPLWSIGTGKTISLLQAEEMVLNIRDFISKKYDKSLKNEIKVLYGGSVNPENSKNFLSLDSLSGLLIGGASLDEQKFSKIIKN